MSYEKEFDLLIEHLKNTLGLAELEKDDENSLTLISEDLIITLINNSGNLLLVSNFGTMNEYNEQEKIKDYLLASNVLFYTTNGGTFGVSEENVISFSFQKPIAALSNESFIDYLDKFVLTIENFRENLQAIEQNTDSSTTSSSDSSTSMEAQLMQQHWQKI